MASRTTTRMGDNDEAPRAETMQRGVTQILFTYLPDRTVDWEGGLAIIKLGGLALGELWEDERANTLLDEVAALLDSWRQRGGNVDPEFPDPRNARKRFSVGPPSGIDAHVLETAFVCRTCSRLHFPKLRALSSNPDASLVCSHCKTRTLRQFGFVFVHGCGELTPISEWVPAFKKRPDGSMQATTFPIRCQNCSQSAPSIPARSERVRDMRVVCASCQQEILDRLTANCPRCINALERAARGGSSGQTSPIAQVAMRVARYNASETYYPQTLTILRLDRPDLTTAADPALDPIEEMLPIALRRGLDAGSPENLGALVSRLAAAVASGNMELQDDLRERIALAARASPVSAEKADEPAPGDRAPSQDLIKGLRESVALRTTVHSKPVQDVARTGGGSSELLLDRVNGRCRSLGLSEVLLVDDLPVMTAAFGYTRRSFEPTYSELGAQSLPTEIRVFPSLQEHAARRLGRADIAGTVPIPAREGEHEGIYLSLDPLRVVRWLRMNGIELKGVSRKEVVQELLQRLETVDRYYDGIWQCEVRRLLFGLIHSLSHAAMRAAARFAGMQRTSLSEYLFLPLMGTVIYDNASEFQLGGLRTMVRDQLGAFLDAIGDEAMDCLYDPECLDHRGACHGCIHSPEICCRFFNHGLSRAFLLGGHAPWADLASPLHVTGFWEMDE